MRLGIVGLYAAMIDLRQRGAGVERVSFEIDRDDVAAALHEQARANGRTVEAEIAALVERTYAPKTRPTTGDANWVEELIRMADGADLSIPQSRAFIRYAPDYPAGMEPLPGETFVDHITRISRPGIELDVERDRAPHDGQRL